MDECNNIAYVLGAIWAEQDLIVADHFIVKKVAGLCWTSVGAEGPPLKSVEWIGKWAYSAEQSRKVTHVAPNRFYVDNISIWKLIVEDLAVTAFQELE